MLTKDILFYNEPMKIKYVPLETPDELEVTIKGHRDDPQVVAFKNYLEQFQGFTIAKKDGQQFRLNLNQIFYIESQGEKTILYTETDSFLSPFRLYEIEAWGEPFVRISKSVIVNLNHLQSFKPLINSKLEATLTNGDRLEVTRMYLADLKNILGGKKK
jgi:DNA-binding LytR/AlgR family response regulator